MDRYIQIFIILYTNYRLYITVLNEIQWGLLGFNGGLVETFLGLFGWQYDTVLRNYRMLVRVRINATSDVVFLYYLEVHIWVIDQ